MQNFLATKEENFGKQVRFSNSEMAFEGLSEFGKSLVDLFKKQFGEQPKIVSFAPGRVEVLGSLLDSV